MRRAPWAILCTVLLLSAACDSSNPVAPAPPETPPGGNSTGTYVIQLSAVPTQLQAGASATLSLTVRRRSNQQAPPNGSSVELNTSLGFFALDEAGEPLTSTSVQLTGGAGQTPFFAGSDLGTAEILALFEDSTSSLRLEVVEATLPPFFIASLSPDVGSGVGGDRVTIRGQGFSEPLRVTFGDATAQLVDGGVSASAIQVTTPPPVPALTAGETRRVDVTVTIELDGEEPRSDTLSGGFLYTTGGGPFNQPAIFSVSPTRGPNAGGTTVTILGQGFEDDARAFFGFDQGDGVFEGVQAQRLSVTGDGAQMTVVTPAASGAGRFLLNQIVDVKVENPRTGLFAVRSAAFQYGSSGGGSLLVSSLAPRQAPYTGYAGDDRVTVTLLGQGFSGGTLQVSLAGVSQDEVTVVDDGRIDLLLSAAPVSSCTPPSGPAVVTNVASGESASSSSDFAYTVPSPFVTGVSPASGSENGGTSVTLSGSGFVGDGPPGDGESAEVTFDGVRATVSTLAADSVSVTAPAFSGDFDMQECDDNGDGVTGMKPLPTAVDVTFTNLANGCSDTLVRGFTYEPADDSCIEAAGLNADFTFSTNALQVTFTNTSSGNPTTFLWDFGDGEQSPQENPVHIYAAAGTYVVTLEVANAGGQSDTVSKPVTVSP